MAHQRKSELNRVLQEGVYPEIAWGLPSDDAHPDGEFHPRSTPPGAPERRHTKEKVNHGRRKSDQKQLDLNPASAGGAKRA